MARSPEDSPVAVIADVHGNRWALEAVLEDAHRSGATRILDLGDILYGPLDPRGTANLLMRLATPAVHISGNEDRAVVDPGADVSAHQSLLYTREALGREHLEWLERLQPGAAVDELYLCHGVPGDDMTYLLEKVDPSGLVSRDSESVSSLIRGISCRVLLCGHSHRPNSVQLPGGPLVVNPGSVGLPAYADDLPYHHVVENGSPHARYALLTRDAGGWAHVLRSVEYDWEAAACTAERHGRPDWARALRTGRV